MNAELIAEVGRATLDGSLPFPEVVRRLLDTGVESYQVDYVALQMSYYGAGGALIKTPLSYENLPQVAARFDIPALQAAILDSQQHGQPFRDFSRRAMLAGVQGYRVFLLGQRVIYWGRLGDQHIEWFPGAGPKPE